jgi:four helix bundle protein
MTTFRDLKAWQKGMDLSVAIYLHTEAFPADERFGLISQMRRASVSIPANISEGRGRDHVKEFLHFIAIAIGSLNELETLLILSERLGFGIFDLDLQARCSETGKLLHGLRNALKKQLPAERI